MDRRGRELFEVGHSRTTRREAHEAAPHAPDRIQIFERPPAAARRPVGPSSFTPPSQTGAQPQALRRRLGAWRPRRSRLLVAAVVLGLAFGAMEEAARSAGYMPDMGRLAQRLGFGIDQVALEGHRFSSDREVFDALDLANVRTFAALDSAAVKARIERLPWIDTAELTRVFPGRLEIRVTERKPYALWTRADQLYLIDKTGRVLASVGGETLPDLPRFAGEGAAAGAASLMEMVARYPDVARRLAEAERISERRWRLKLDNASTIELPADGEVGALEELMRSERLLGLVAAGHTTLDFRGPGRVAVRSEPAPASTASASQHPES